MNKQTSVFLPSALDGRMPLSLPLSLAPVQADRSHMRRRDDQQPWPHMPHSGAHGSPDLNAVAAQVELFFKVDNALDGRGNPRK